MRNATRKRETNETYVMVDLNIDGSGKCDCQFDLPSLNFLKHMLDQMTEYAHFDLVIEAESKDKIKHHLNEDIAIVLGEVFKEALGYGEETKRYGDASIPMDDTLAEIAVDIGGRSYYQVRKFELKNNGLEQEINHFLSSFVKNAGINLNVFVEGENDHHKVEAIYKALGIALNEAKELIR